MLPFALADLSLLFWENEMTFRKGSEDTRCKRSVALHLPPKGMVGRIPPLPPTSARLELHKKRFDKFGQAFFLRVNLAITNNFCGQYDG